jgi:hypothetical protein
MRVPNPGAVSGHDGLLLHFSESTCKPRARRLSWLNDGKALEIALLSQALRDLNMKLRRQASLAIPLSSIVSMLQTCDWFRSL